MARGVRTFKQLKETIEAFAEFDEFVVDVETQGLFRAEPHRNEVFWVSLSGPGRTDVIPCGHPIGERCFVEDETHRYKPNTNNRRHQEHRVNEETGRVKWFDIPEPFTPAPQQLMKADVMKAIKPLFFRGRTVVGHNVKFDVRSLAKYFDKMPPGPFGDTMVAARLINENHFGHMPYSLGTCAKRELHVVYDKIGKDVEKHPYSEAHKYSYLDARVTWELWKLYKKLLEREGVRHIFDLEMELLPVVIDMEETGVGIDSKALRYLRHSFEIQLARLQIALDDVYGKPINLNAPKQLAELVYDIRGHTCQVYTEKTGAPSTSKSALEKFAKRDKTVQRVLEHRAIKKLSSTFVDGITNALDNGRIHPTFKQTGTVSGRLSCSEPNVQQVPSRTELGRQIRSLFRAKPGHMLIVSDLSQIELRILAYFTQDPKLLEAYQKNLDLHAATARKVFGKDFTGDERSLAKNTNFSTVYGAGAGTLVAKYGVPTMAMAQDLLDAFYSTYVYVKPWQKKVVRQAEKRVQWAPYVPGERRRRTGQPYVETILGRKRRLPDLLSSDRYDRSSAQRQAVSVVIQGTAADLFKVIMIDLQNQLNATYYHEGWRAHLLMTVHDEVVVEAPEEYAEDCLALTKTTMEEVKNPYTHEPFLGSVPIIADAKMVELWSDAKTPVKMEKEERTYKTSR